MIDAKEVKDNASIDQQDLAMTSSDEPSNGGASDDCTNDNMNAKKATIKALTNDVRKTLTPLWVFCC